MRYANWTVEIDAASLLLLRHQQLVNLNFHERKWKLENGQELFLLNVVAEVAVVTQRLRDTAAGQQHLPVLQSC